VRVFIDYRCNRFFQNGVDVPLAAVPVTLNFPNGAKVTRETRSFGLVNFSGYGVAGGVTVSAALPNSYKGYSVSYCANSPTSVQVQPKDIQFGHKFVEFRGEVTGELAGP
jgi:hypothetical protein